MCLLGSCREAEEHVLQDKIENDGRNPNSFARPL